MDKKDGFMEYNTFVSLHHLQLESSAVPIHFWPSLYKKINGQIFDAGNAFNVYKIDYEDEERGPSDSLYKVVVSQEGGMNCQDGFNIFLIDHAWTYNYNNAAKNLTEIPGLLDRMCNLMGICGDLSPSEKLSCAMKEMWRYNQTYSHSGTDVEERLAVWYIMDEFGSAIQHSDNSNCRVVPFFSLLDQTTYSLLFPIRNVEKDYEVMRNYVEGPLSVDKEVRKALLLPWRPLSFMDVSFAHKEPGEDYFVSGRVAETFPVAPECSVREGATLKVFSDYKYVVSYLKAPGFEIVQTREDADVLWLMEHFKGYRELSPGKFVNQFPCENVLTVKDLFCIVCRRKGESRGQYPAWLPITYNLNTELVEFCSYFQHREAQHLDNHWICKPWNLARGLDIYITDNLNCVLRLPFTGPKVAQKYIDTPVLFHRPEIGSVKFDVRYVVLLRSTKPLKAFAYRKFFLRFANKPFELNDLTDYEKHFTVMNYQEEARLCKVLCDQFVEEFDRQHPSHEWRAVEERIFEALRGMLEAATMAPPPRGIPESPQSRALYAVDLMLAWDRGLMQPLLLELNWAPDCQRACEYYPDFYNDVFQLLFRDVVNEDMFRAL